MTNPQLILASGSPRRRELLKEAGYSFEVIVPRDDAECGMCSSDGPIELVSNLAFRKAADVRRQLTHRNKRSSAVIVAADTVAECNGQILGKPSNETHARQMLELLSGRRHHVFTGVCVWAETAFSKGDSRAPLVRVAETVLQMDCLPKSALSEYLETGLWEGKAGAFGYQDRLGWVHIVAGSESNVVGLPLELLANMLHEVAYPRHS